MKEPANAEGPKEGVIGRFETQGSNDRRRVRLGGGGVFPVGGAWSHVRGSTDGAEVGVLAAVAGREGR